jgi:hypothetical protein
VVVASRHDHRDEQSATPRLAGAAGAIVLTLVASPTATDRVSYASGVLLVAAFAVGAQYLFTERVVRTASVAGRGLRFASRGRGLSR